MVYHAKEWLSIDEIALLAAEIEPWKRTICDAEQQQLANWEKARTVEDFLITAIRNNDFPDCDLDLKSRSKESCKSWGLIEPAWETPLNEVLENDGSIEADSRIKTAALRTWLETKDIYIPDIFPPASRPSQQPTNGQLSPGQIEAINQLLAGIHECQTDQLAYAIKAWLGTSDLWQKNLPSQRTPKAELAAWLEEMASEKDLVPEQRERILLICNWKSKGGRPKKEPEEE